MTGEIESILCWAAGSPTQPPDEAVVDGDALLMKANDAFIRLSAHNLSLNTWV